MNILVRPRTGQVTEAEGSSWPTAVGVIAVCLLAMGLIFQEEVIGAFRVWMDSATYNHCFLIIPIALYMIWQRRHEIAPLSPQPNYPVLVLVPLLSLAWFGLSVIGILEGRQFLVMTIVQVTLLGVLGWPVYKRLLAPFLYLYFLVPSGEFLVPSLQDFTARFAVLGLQVLHIPVYSDGTIIEVPAGPFTVAEACAGLRFLIAAIAFGVFYAVEIYDSWIRRALFIALSIVVPIIANGFRALGLIVAAQAFGSAAAVEADHVTYGWIFFSLVLIALIFIGRSFSDRDTAAPTERAPVVPSRGGATPAQLSAAGILALLLAALGPAVGYAFDASPVPVALKQQGPEVGGSWQRLATTPEEWRPRVIRADKEVAESFSDGAAEVDRFVALYLPHGRENNLIRSDNRVADMERWAIGGRGRPNVQIGGRQVRVNETQLVGARGTRRLVWSFYVLDGIVTSTILEAKQHQVRAYFARSGCPSAFMAVSADANDPAARQTLQRYLNAIEPLQPYLCGPTRG